MKSLKKHVKYVFAAFLFLFCFSAVLIMPAQAADEDTYVLVAVFAGADIGNEETAPTVTIMLEDGSEVDLWVTENSRFIGIGNTTLAQFAEEFVGQMAIIEFVVYGDEYILVECTLISVM